MIVPQGELTFVDECLPLSRSLLLPASVLLQLPPGRFTGWQPARRQAPGAVARENPAMGEGGAPAAYQPPFGGKPTQAAADVLKGGDARIGQPGSASGRRAASA
ncbi:MULTISPECIES: hypothetical protein [Streptomyces]|uniref:hypothetical protein n=1 Tax=Streptomyces TaxID=1883 RepID=UPI0022490ADC|nr:hypothetical protein [Streptomyces sp. JHD 1]MCX2969415.1 hypothetical protein [Streptomyces sp. JHD 1]